MDNQQLVTLAVVVAAAFFTLDVWRRSAPAAALQRRMGLVLPLWFAAAAAFTLSPALRAAAAGVPWLQPLLTVAGTLAVVSVMRSAAVRAAIDSQPFEALMAVNSWRAVFGGCLLAYSTGGVLPAAFALPAAFGDMAAAFLMTVLLAVAQRRGRMPHGPLVVWNTLGLLDLLNAMVLVVTVVRPWAARQGIVAGNFTLATYVVPVFIGLHLHIYASLWRRRTRGRPATLAAA